MPVNGTLDVTVDGGVTFTFVVESTDGPVEVTFRSGQRADVAVTDTESGEEVWRWSAGRMFTQVISTVELASGETLDRTFTWNDPPAGSYEAEATLEDTNGSASATATFSV